MKIQQMEMMILTKSNKTTSPMKSMIALGIIMGILVLIMFIPALSEDSKVGFEVNRTGRFTRLDYEPIALLNGDWNLKFWSIETSEGEGEYQINYYPFITGWKLYIYGFDDNYPIAEQNYIIEGEVPRQPYSKISITVREFTSNNFDKSIVILKLRINLFLGNRSVTDRIDFSLELEGEATTLQYGLIMGLPLMVIGVSIIIYSSKRKVNQHFITRVSYLSFFFKHLWIYLFRRIKGLRKQ